MRFLVHTVQLVACISVSGAIVGLLAIILSFFWGDRIDRELMMTTAHLSTHQVHLKSDQELFQWLAADRGRVANELVIDVFETEAKKSPRWVKRFLAGLNEDQRSTIFNRVPRVREIFQSGS